MQGKDKSMLQLSGINFTDYDDIYYIFWHLNRFLFNVDTTKELEVKAESAAEIFILSG